MRLGFVLIPFFFGQLLMAGNTPITVPVERLSELRIDAGRIGSAPVPLNDFVTLLSNATARDRLLTEVLRLRAILNPRELVPDELRMIVDSIDGITNCEISLSTSGVPHAYDHRNFRPRLAMGRVGLASAFGGRWGRRLPDRLAVFQTYVPDSREPVISFLETVAGVEQILVRDHKEDPSPHPYEMILGDFYFRNPRAFQDRLIHKIFWDPSLSKKTRESISSFFNQPGPHGLHFPGLGRSIEGNSFTIAGTNFRFDPSDKYFRWKASVGSLSQETIKVYLPLPIHNFYDDVQRNVALLEHIIPVAIKAGVEVIHLAGNADNMASISRFFFDFPAKMSLEELGNFEYEVARILKEFDLELKDLPKPLFATPLPYKLKFSGKEISDPDHVLHMSRKLRGDLSWYGFLVDVIATAIALMPEEIKRNQIQKFPFWVANFMEWVGLKGFPHLDVWLSKEQ